MGDQDQPIPKTKNEHELFNPHRCDPFDFYSKDDKGRPVRFVPKLLGDFIIKGVPVLTLSGSNEMYFYNKNIYNENGKEHINQLCATILKDYYSRHRVSEVISYIQACTYIDPNELNSGWLNLENGLFNPLMGEFITHTPDIFTIKRIPFAYDPEADCPKWKAELERKVDKPTRTVLQEFFGYMFMPGQKYERAMLLYGPKRTMKSTTLRVLQHVIGKDNCTAMSLQKLSEDHFAAAYLYGIPINVCADIDARAIKYAGIFMQITGGDKISSGKKGQHFKHFFPSTKLVFSANIIPPAPNLDIAYYRRWLLMPFERETPQDEVNPNIEAEFIEELPGILNWAIEGLKRLEKNAGFTYWLSDEDNRDMYERHSNSIQSFIYRKIDMELDEGKITKREVYQKYKDYCTDEGLNIDNIIKFGRMFKELTGCGIGKSGEIPAYTGVNFQDGNNNTKLEDYVEQDR